MHILKKLYRKLSSAMVSFPYNCRNFSKANTFLYLKSVRCKPGKPLSIMYWQLETLKGKGRVSTSWRHSFVIKIPSTIACNKAIHKFDQKKMRPQVRLKNFRVTVINNRWKLSFQILQGSLRVMFTLSILYNCLFLETGV